MTSAEASHWQALCLVQQYELERLRAQAQPYLDWCQRHPAPLVEQNPDNNSLVIRCQEISLTIRPEACDSELFELQLSPENDKRVQIWHLCSLQITGKKETCWIELCFYQNSSLFLVISAEEICHSMNLNLFYDELELVSSLVFKFSEGMVSPAQYTLIFPRADALPLQETILKTFGEWSESFRDWAQIDHAAIHKRISNGTL